MSINRHTDTITAIATTPGLAGIAIVRISGPEATKIASKITNNQDFTPNKIVFCTFQNQQKKALDQGLISFFQAPHSYTGEDVVELNCHGGFVIANELLKTSISLGARLAQPGEFTLRAFLNGKVDLMQAEAVIDIIEAKTEKSSQLSLNQLKGKTSNEIKTIRNKLLQLISHLEVHLDYPEEENFETNEHYEEEISDIINKTEQLITSFKTGKIYRQGLTTVIVGKPNVGKSSLLNGLLREHRAIVTDIPGTTRDTVEEWINLEGIPLKLIDTAGVRESRDTIENLGINKTLNFIKNADLVIWLLDADTGIEQEDKTIIETLNFKNVIPIINKTDITPNKISQIENQLSLLPKLKLPLKISLLEKTSIQKIENQLLEFIEKKLINKNLSSNTFGANERQLDQLINAKNSLKHAQETINKELTEDFWLIDLKKAMSALGEIIGEEVTDEILTNIFSRFCVGK